MCVGDTLILLRLFGDCLLCTCLRPEHDQTCADALGANHFDLIEICCSYFDSRLGLAVAGTLVCGSQT